MVGSGWLFVGYILVLHLSIVGCSLVDEQACANHVHEECKCDLRGISSSALENEEDESEQWCKKLQLCAKCMAVSRCQSTYLKQYRSLLLSTLKLSEATMICQGINYQALMETVRESRKPCKDGETSYDECGQRCTCLNGSLICYRLRKEFTRMSFKERTRYISAFYKATTDLRYKDDFEAILNEHSYIPNTFLHHMPQIFLPWHRWFLTKVEDFLRQIDCRITIPYFQWTAASGHIWRTTNPTDVWSSGPQGLGGNGIPPSMCVQDGPFRAGSWKIPISKGGGCLKRSFNYSCQLYDEDYLHQILRLTNFTAFEFIVREKFHNDFHDCVGRLMHHHFAAGNTPEFYLHHSFIDKIWSLWQEKGNAFKYQYYVSINIRMPKADRYPWEFLDNENLPGNIKVAYEKFQEHESLS